MNEYQMMTNTPRALFDYYLSQLSSGFILTFDQKIKFEYLKKIFIVGYEAEEDLL